MVTLVAALADEPGDGELYEYVILENQSLSTQELIGWSLVNRRSAETYSFPAISLHPGEQLVLWSGAGEDDPASGTLFWPSPGPHWAAGDTAELRSPTGQVVSTLEVSVSEAGEE